MRTVRQSPVFRVVRSQRPYTPARELWKERLEMQRRQQQQLNGAQDPFARKAAVESVPDGRHDDSCRCDPEHREPISNECGPLRFSEDGQGEGSSDAEDTLSRHAIERPLHAQDSDNVNCLDDSSGRMSLISLIRSSNSAADQLEGQEGGQSVTSMDERFQAMSVARQQERWRVQRALKQEKSVATRRRVLMSILGMKRFYKTLSLVREVKGTRERLLLQCSKDPSATPTKKVAVCKVKFDNLPRSARDLMARTHLVAAIELTEVERLQKLPWDELIAEAQANLNAYREWISISETRE